MIGTPAGFVVAGLIPSIGMFFFWYLKWKARDKVPLDTFETFFLGGAKIGQYLTTNNNWGLCFAFANAVWYYAFLGYYYGPWIVLLQLPWSISIIGLAILLRRYISASKDGTVHGFIGHNFGPNAAILAAVATVLGYTLNCGFEIFYSAHLMAVSFNVIYAELAIAILIAIFIGGYCTAGGYLGSVITDPYQNILGVIAVLTLLYTLGPAVSKVNGDWNILHTSAKFDAPQWYFILGVSVFTFFFNFVDMANWQSLAANRELPDEKLKGVRWGLIQSAVMQMMAPAIVGVWLGVALKTIKAGIPDDGYFQFAFGIGFPRVNFYSGLLLGLILLGFLAVTISSAGSYILAAMQTLAVDLFKRRSYAIYSSLSTPPDQKLEIEQNILDWVKRSVIPTAVFMTLAFAALYYFLDTVGSQGVAFQFQFVMYGAAVTLVPVVISRLFRSEDSDATLVQTANVAGFWSILVGLLFVIVPFVLAAFFWSEPLLKSICAELPFTITSDMIINLTPLSGLIFASITFGVASRLRRRSS